MGKVKFKIMTFNVQCFGNINRQIEMQRKIMNKNNAAIVAMQELSTSRHINYVGQAALIEYPHIYMSDHKAFLGFASKAALKNVKARDFRQQDPQDMIQWGQTRAYHMADLEIEGRTVTLINAHLCFLTQAVKFAQMKELFDVAQKSKYCILTGDFNCFATVKGDNEYFNMYQSFINAGYQMANCAESITKTWTDSPYPKGLSGFTYPTDNIIVSPGIKLKKVYFDKTKLKYENGDPVDHIPIIALVEIR